MTEKNEAEERETGHLCNSTIALLPDKAEQGYASIIKLNLAIVQTRTELTDVDSIGFSQFGKHISS